MEVSTGGGTLAPLPQGGSKWAILHVAHVLCRDRHFDNQRHNAGCGLVSVTVLLYLTSMMFKLVICTPDPLTRGLRMRAAGDSGSFATTCMPYGCGPLLCMHAVLSQHAVL